MFCSSLCVLLREAGVGVCVGGWVGGGGGGEGEHVFVSE